MRDLMSRVLLRLEEYGLVLIGEDVVSLSSDWFEKLEGGVDIEAHMRAVRLYEKQRGERWVIREDAKGADEAVRRREELLEETARACGLELDQWDPQEQEQERPPQPEKATVEASEEEQKPDLLESFEDVRELAREVLGSRGGPRRDPLVGGNTAKARHYRGARERWARACAAHKGEPLPRREADPDAPTSDLAEALLGYLKKNPERAGESASWLANTLRAYDLVEGKPMPQDVAEAREKLFASGRLRRPPPDISMTRGAA